MNIDDMRHVVSAAYSGPGWKRKVAAMSDDQVIAVYYRVVTGRTAIPRKNDKSTTVAQAYMNITNALVEVAEKNAKVKDRKPYDFEEDGPKQMSFADILEG